MLSKKELSEKMHEAKKLKASLPFSTYIGTIEIGDMSLQCCVLNDGRRILKESAISNILGTSGGKNTKIKEGLAVSNGPTPMFLASKALEPFINKVFDRKDLEAVQYIQNNKLLTGYDATILPKVCDIWLMAKDENTLQHSQLPKAKKAEILMRGLAHVGIIALIDEATGYQYERPRKELEAQLKKFLSDSLRRWSRTFPVDYFKELCRLRGVELRPDMKLPQYFGCLTNNLVYKRLAPGLLEKLKEQKFKKGKNHHKLTQWLSSDVGVPEILVHLGMVIAIMKQHESYENFEKTLDKIAPMFPDISG